MSENVSIFEPSISDRYVSQPIPMKTDTAEVHVVPETSSEFGTSHLAPLAKTYTYQNFTSTDLALVSRDGHPIKLPREPRSQLGGNWRYGKLIITLEYVIRNNGIELDPQGQLQYEGQDRADIQSLRQAFRNSQSSYTNGIRFRICYSVSEQHLKDKGGLVYLTDLDLTVSFWSTWHAHHATINHPYTDSFIRKRLLTDDVDINSMKRLAFTMFIVSNNGDVDSKYINIAGQVYRIPVIQDIRFRDGVYVCHDRPGTAQGAPPEGKRLTLDEAKEQYRIFDTYDQAKVEGDPDTANKKRLEEQKLKNQEQAAELERLKQERQQKEEELAQMKQRMEEEKAKREEEMARQKQEREERSLRRRETSELVRYTPAIVTGIIGIVTLVLKWFT